MPEGAQQGQEQSGAAVQTGAWVDPYRAYNFKLEINSVTEGHFTECSGLGVKVDVISYREGGNNQIVHRMPGQVSYAEITLRYGLTNSRDMWTWFLTAVSGKVERRNVTIVLMDSSGAAPVMSWILRNAWISEWRGAPLDASGHEVAVETMTLVFEELQSELG